jgi:hypothetical protein
MSWPLLAIESNINIAQQFRDWLRTQQFFLSFLIPLYILNSHYFIFINIDITVGISPTFTLKHILNLP